MTETVETRWQQHNDAGRRFFDNGDYANAEHAFIAAIREATLLGADNARLATSLSNLGQLKYRQKDLSQAEALLRRSLAIRERVSGGDHVGLVQNINNLAALHVARGELAQAEPLFRRALDIGATHLGERHPDVGVTLSNLARLYFRKSEFDHAAPLLLRLLTLKEEALGAQHPEVTAIVGSLARVRAAQGNLEEAERLSRRVVAAREAATKPDDPSLAPSLEALADVLAARGKPDEERALRERAQRLRGGSPTPAAAAASALGVELRPLAADAVPPAPPRSAPRSSSGVTRSEVTTGARRNSTTKTTTLPWIEPPTSPALKRPAPVQPIQPAPSAGPVSATTTADASDVMHFVPPSAMLAAPQRAEPAAHEGRHRSGSRIERGSGPRDRSEDPVIEPHLSEPFEFRRKRRRPWVIALAVVVVLLVAGAAVYAYLDQRAALETGAVSPNGSVPADERPASTPAPLQTAPAEAVSLPTDSTVATATPPKTTESTPPERREARTTHAADKPEAKTSSHSSTEAHEVKPDHVASATRTPAPDTTVPPGALPQVDVSTVTNQIATKAKKQVDSAGRTITVKPPTFQKP